jgi:hypothetical protein
VHSVTGQTPDSSGGRLLLVNALASLVALSLGLSQRRGRAVNAGRMT